MPLTLVLGPANSAKAGEVLGAFGEAAHRGALLVVPTALDAEHYSRELAQRGAVLGSVLTFRGLAREIAARTGYQGRRLSRLQRELVVRRVVEGLDFQVLARSAEAPGFAGAAGELIAELQRSLITPQRFGQALSAWAAADSRRAGYAHDVAAIYRGYRVELDRIGRVDAELYASRALDALRDAPGRWGSEPVFVYGFDDLTAIERDAIETLCRIVGVDVTVSLTYEAGRTALGARAEVVEELRALSDRVRELPGLDAHYESASRAALHHLERFLFEPDGERVDPGDSVRLLEAAGDRAEAELVAAEVIGLMRAGVPAEEIVVVYRSLSRSAAVIERVFARYGIPLASHRRVPFTHTSLGRSVRALARCALLGSDPTHAARAEDLLDYLRTPGFLERPEIADGLEADLRRDGIRTAAQARERLGWGLEEIDSLRAARDVPAELARHARRLFSLPHRGSAAQLDPGEEQDAHALTTLLRAVAELEELGPGLSGAQVLDLLEELEVELEPRAATLAGSVLLAEPLAIRARRFRAVFVCGLGEGEFPLAGAGEPFLSDEQRHELALASGLRLAPAENALDRERYLFYACVSRASERVVLSYRSSDEEGNLALPSPFVADVADLFVPEWSQRRRRRLLADVVWCADEAPTERERALAAAHERSVGVMPSNEEPGVRVLGAAALSHVRHSEVVSGGALESFADCPVRWLVERELAPERFEPDSDALTRGNYMHAALEDVIARLEGPVTPATLPDALRILDDVLEELPPTVAAGRPEAVREATLRSIAADLRRYLEHEAAGGAGWEPRGLELRFGFTEEEGSLPMLVLGRGDARAFVRGVIDRVDVDPAGSRRAIVRDYKSTSARPEHQGARWEADRQLQVALYMIVVRELLGLEPVAGLYQPLGGGDLRPRGVFLEGTPIGSGVVANDAREQPELDAVLAAAEERAVALAMELRSGRLAPCPQTCSRDGCRYPGICWAA
jgi:ATP-dependent helicase/DNAse subunit B